MIQPGDRILFQGDSITDCGRVRGQKRGANHVGDGYVAQLAGWFQALRPELRVEVLNRGCSGDRTAELLTRWQVDCLDLRPQVLSLKIGVNDVWRKLGTWNGQTYIALPEYVANVEQLLAQARKAGIRDLVLISPTTITQDNHSEINDLLGDYALAVRELAARYEAVWVDARTPLLHARAGRPEVPWTPDGCHPSAAGHGLIAAAWWRAVMG